MPARVRGFGILPSGSGRGRTASAARAIGVAAARSVTSMAAYSSSW